MPSTFDASIYHRVHAFLTETIQTAKSESEDRFMDSMSIGSDISAGSSSAKSFVIEKRHCVCIDFLIYLVLLKMV